MFNKAVKSKKRPWMWMTLVFLVIVLVFTINHLNRLELGLVDPPTQETHPPNPITFNHSPSPSSGGLDLLRFEYEDGLSISSTHKDMTYQVTFDHVGINQTYAIKSIAFQKADKHLLIESSTDWLGPLVFKRQNKADPREDKPRFTGGWHGSNGDGTGQSTSASLIKQVMVGGKPITNHTSGVTDQVQLLVINLTKPYNSNTYSLCEKILYDFNQEGLSFDVTLIALEDLVIETYYGLQTQNTSFDDLIHYHFNDGSVVQASLMDESHAGLAKAQTFVNQVTISGKDTPFYLRARLKGVGDLDTSPYVAANLPNAFTKTYGKSYFNIINGIPLPLKKYETLKWHGEYIFGSVDTTDKGPRQAKDFP